MPLTAKGEKIKGAMEEKYGKEKGEEVFYASKNKGTITGVDDDDRIPLEEGKSRETVNRNVKKLIGVGHNKEAAYGIAEKKAHESKDDDNQHMGFTEEGATSVEKLISGCDALATRLDAFESRRSMRKPEDVKPRTKDQMQPSNRHPKEVHQP